MGTNLYIGNLAFSETEDSINQLFSQHGSVISSIDGREVSGRQMKVNEARPKENRTNGGFRSSFGGGQNRGGRSY